MKLEPGINRQIIEQISELKHDPDWMREFRLNCLEIFDELNYPDWGPDISGLDLNNISCLHLSREYPLMNTLSRFCGTP